MLCYFPISHIRSGIHFLAKFCYISEMGTFFCAFFIFEKIKFVIGSMLVVVPKVFVLTSFSNVVPIFFSLL
ncbi:hypothetical protein DsansV1_C15g0137701 [Dioscorea sansibarensis]